MLLLWGGEGDLEYHIRSLRESESSPQTVGLAQIEELENYRRKARFKQVLQSDGGGGSSYCR